MSQPTMSFRDADHPRERDGKFATVGRPEAADIDLGSVAPPKGSFFYPPFLHNAAEAISFWENVEIPDEAIARVAGSYVAQWQTTVDFFPDMVWEAVDGPRYDVEHPQPTDRSKMAAWIQAKDSYRNETVAAFRERLRNRPEFLDPRDARTAAKVIGLAGATKNLSSDEAQLVREHQVETTQGWLEVRQVNRDFGLAVFEGSVLDRTGYVDNSADDRIADKVARAVDVRIESLRTEMRDEFIQNAANLQQVTGIIVDVSPDRK